MMTSYLPLLAHPAFYLGIILVAVGTLIAYLRLRRTGADLLAVAEQAAKGDRPARS